ncbi:MAG: argininosuccinate synthase [Candidatus Falkowbacteria bacterium]|nr:argininosuccinate synthase [Candidatus Falkowbacteria bacterium]
MNVCEPAHQGKLFETNPIAEVIGKMTLAMHSKIIPPKRAVLLYSGGLDTSVILHYMVHALGYEVTTFTANLGQRDLRSKEEIEQKAFASGASRVIVNDLQLRLVQDHILPCMCWDAKYAGNYHLCCSLARPLTIQGAIEAVKDLSGEVIFSHGATGKGNDQVRFELGAMALRPGVEIFAPWKDKAFRKQFPGRDEMIAYAKRYNIPVSATSKKPWSSDGNLSGETYEAGPLEDPNWNNYPEEMFKLGVSPKLAPNQELVITIYFSQGIPVEVDGIEYGLIDIIKCLNELGGNNGIGRTDTTEWRRVGMKSRGVYEEPALHILWKAYAALERLTVSPDYLRIKDSLRSEFSRMVYFGEWFTPAMQALMPFGQVHNQYVTGDVTLRLYKGNCDVIGRSSPNSLYDSKVASMHEDNAEAYNQSDAKGYIQIVGLPLRVQATQGRDLRIRK